MTAPFPFPVVVGGQAVEPVTGFLRLWGEDGREQESYGPCTSREAYQRTYELSGAVVWGRFDRADGKASWSFGDISIEQLARERGTL